MIKTSYKDFLEKNSEMTYSNVLHRIIKVRSSDYIILGDNCINKEYGITDEDLIGVMTGYVRNGKKHTVNEFGYRIYCRVWVDFSSVRIFCKLVNSQMRRLIKHEK